jgi:ABC-type glycerol-3-phosphate transport system permease component
MTLSGSFFKIGPARLFVHFTVLVIVVIWLIPTLGIFVSALRDKDQIVVSGWWTAFAGSSRTVASRLGLPDQQTQDGAVYVIAGNVLQGKVRSFHPGIRHARRATGRLQGRRNRRSRRWRLAARQRGRQLIAT